ncbi:MAG: CHAT domain-containing protein, partial [Cyanobacteria bacterium J06631_2]
EEESVTEINNTPADNLIANNFFLRSPKKIAQLFDPNAFPRLEATEREAQEIQSILNLPAEQIKLQSQANETLLKQVQSPYVLHIATHGFFLDKLSQTDSNVALNQIDGNPLLRSGLALAGVTSNLNQVQPENDGILTAYETTLLNLARTELVVLSACDTGRGDVSTGEGIYGLRRALVIAGSKSQLISLWKVEDEGTKNLMTAYYKQLMQGVGRTEALHEVQKQMLRGVLKRENGQSYQHPYYWASFIPSGDWTPIEMSDRN